MKTSPTLLTLLLAAALAAGTPSRAEDGPHHDSPPDTTHHDHPGDGSPGGDHEDHHGLRLTATADAPAGSAGEAHLDLSDAGAPALAIEVNGLAAGTYTVSVTTASSTTPVSLGTFDVAGTAAEASLALPAGFDPGTLSAVQIADASGTLLLAGAREMESEDAHFPDFHLSPTADAPAGARGEAQIDTTVATAPALTVEVRALPAGTYTVNVVSIASGAVTALGTFDVTAPTGSETAEATATLALPTGVMATDLASVQVLDANGVLLLAGGAACHGGDVAGTEHLHQQIALTASAAAPAGLTGRAELEAHDRRGTSAAVLEIAVKGLPAADYTVSVVSQATGTTTVLATLTSTGPGLTRLEIGSEHGTAFPAGFNPLDIASVQIADATGAVLLSGDFLGTAAGNATSFVASVKTTAGVAAPRCVGSAAIVASVVRKVVRQKFALVAKGAPVKAVLTLKVNGVTAGQVKTNRAGGLAVSKLPAGIRAQSVTSVTLETAAGARVLGAFF